MLTVETYLRDGPGQIEAASPVDYFVRTRDALADPDAVAARGRAAGQALGDDPAAAVAEIAERVLALVAAAGDEAYVETPVADMWLADYLPTRTFELAVHGCDLAVACDLEADVPERSGGGGRRGAGGPGRPRGQGRRSAAGGHRPARSARRFSVSERAGQVRCSASRWRAITMRCTWLVPSKIWVTLASRMNRSAGKSRV